MSERLDFLVRRNKGKDYLNTYKQFFKGFNLKGLEYIELEEADKIRYQIRRIFPSIKQENEIVSNDKLSNSKLISEASNRIDHNDYCFIFTDEVYNCGMFKCTTRSALDSCLNIAFLAYDNTCFLTDCNFKFHFTVNYEDATSDEYFDTYEIQRKWKI